jgi:membrane associated rhomboid family serine protease
VVLPIRDENPTSRLPIVTIALIAVNLFVYFLVQPHESTNAENEFLYEHAAVPCEITGGEPVVGIPVDGFGFQRDTTTVADTTCAVGIIGGSAIPQQLFPAKSPHLSILQSMFMHGSVAHVLGNMLFLWIFGNNVEDRLRPIPYLLFYLFAGIVATLVFVFLNSDSTAPLVGASGAIAGVMGAYLVWFPHARVLSLVGFFPIYLPAVFVLGIWFVMQFATNPNEGVAWQAHVGGFVAGMAMGFLGRPFLRPPVLPPAPFARRWGDDDDDRDDGWDGGFRGGYPGRS